MKRVAVTTAQDTARRVGEALVAHDLAPVYLPCISISPSLPPVLERLRADAAAADLIVLTSARAVRVTWPDGHMPDTPVAAVGPGTAEAVRRAGGTVAHVGSAGAASLLDELDVAGATVVFPHARAADPATATGLEERGARVVAGAAYDTIPIAPADDMVDAALFGSPSAVAGWMLRRHLEGLVVAAMGDTTATALRARGADRPVVPAHPGFAAAARALAERMDR